MKEYYNINQPQLAVLFLPTFLRNPLLTSLVAAIVAPAGTIQAQIVSKIESVDTNTYTQVCALESVLNDNFDYYERRIQVSSLDIDKDYLLHKRSLNSFQTLRSRASSDTFMVSSRNMTGIQSPDFAVIFPSGFLLSDNEKSRLNALIKQNKLASKQYTIRYE